jgi:hypothetical protein
LLGLRTQVLPNGFHDLKLLGQGQLSDFGDAHDMATIRQPARNDKLFSERSWSGTARPGRPMWNESATAPLPAPRLLNEAASAAEEGRSDRADMACVFITFFPVYKLELLARALAGVPGK